MKNKVTAAVFCLLLFGFTAWSLFKPDVRFSERENRMLAARPEWSAAGLFAGTFTREYEEYITDQFPERDSWVSLKVLAERLSGRKETNDVYFGKNGYLLEKFPASDYRSEQAVKNKKALRVFLEQMQNRFGEERVKAVLVPGAASVLTEQLPFMAVPYPEQEELACWREEMPGILDLSGIREENTETGLYYRTDHHWTTEGAYEAYRLWASDMGFEPAETGEFAWETLSEEFLGTVYSKAGYPGMKPDAILAPRFSGEDAVRVEYDRDGQKKESLYERKHLETKDKYAVFLDGNHSLADIHTSVENGRTLLLVKDSYANCFVPFAARHYERILVVDLRYFNMDLEAFLREEQVTDVCLLYQFHGFVEDRNIYKLNR